MHPFRLADVLLTVAFILGGGIAFACWVFAIFSIPNP